MRKIKKKKGSVQWLHFGLTVPFGRECVSILVYLESRHLFIVRATDGRSSVLSVQQKSTPLTRSGPAERRNTTWTGKQRGSSAQLSTWCHTTLPLLLCIFMTSASRLSSHWPATWEVNCQLVFSLQGVWAESVHLTGIIDTYIFIMLLSNQMAAWKELKSTTKVDIKGTKCLVNWKILIWKRT